MNEADRPPVDLVANATIREHFQRRLAATPPATTGRTSAFDRLGHRTPAHQEESKWAPLPEMTPRKIDHGQQPYKEQEAKRAVSQKHRSQSWPCEEANPKRGRTEGEGKPGKIQVGIDWSTTGIQKPVSKPDSRPPPPSSKLDASGPSVKSTVTKVSQRHTSASRTRTGPEGNFPAPPTLSSATRRRGKSRTSPIDG